MNNIDTILHLIRLIEYCKEQLVMVDSNMEMGFAEKTERKEQLRHNLLRANEYYYEITSANFRKVA